ncbi:hypothetical protein ACFLYC_00535 [Chloroflexota bacterium]
MVKKSTLISGMSEYPRRRRSSNPLDTIFDDVMNVVLGLGLQKMSKEVAGVLGLLGITPEQKMKQARSQLSLKKLEMAIAREKRREEEARERAAILWQKHQRQQALDEKRTRIYNLQIQEKELALERSREHQSNLLNQRTEIDLHILTEPVAGVLETTANPSGLTGPQVQQEAYKTWLDGLESGREILILGKRGSGKSALAAKMAEYMMAVHRMPCYWIGLPEAARDLLPHWVKITNTLEKVPVGSFLVCDEAGINYLSLLFNTSQNRFMRKLLMIARQRHISLVFAGQNSRDIDWAITRQADTIIFKELGLNQTESERTHVKTKAKRAVIAFKEIAKQERVEFGYVCDTDFEGLIRFTLPSFWTEDLSHIYSQLNLSEIDGQTKSREELDRAIDGETHYLDTSSLDKEIIELRRKGYGIERIAKTLKCKVWQVRKCLDALK